MNTNHDEDSYVKAIDTLAKIQLKKCTEDSIKRCRIEESRIKRQQICMYNCDLNLFKRSLKTHFK